MNYKLTIAFDGASFSGWQFQKNAPTVQAVMTEAAQSFFTSPATVTGCSRTDSGVHAEYYVCNVKTERTIPPDAVVRGMNTLLPDSVAVKGCECVPEDFHARYDCKSKEYHYKILNTNIPDPFLAHRAYKFGTKLDVDKMAEDAAYLVGTHDFASFMASGSKIVDTTRTVFNTSVERDGDLITFSISADGFLYNMVRIITGTLIDLNLGRAKHSMREIIEMRERSVAGFTAPPDGLYLFKVNY